MLWKVPDASIEPELTLANWQVYQTETGDCHLVGYCLERGEGRVSTAITAFDPVSCCALTRSGRSYQLRGSPGFNGDADYVWQGWKYVNSVTSAENVTRRVWDAIEAHLKEQTI